MGSFSDKDLADMRRRIADKMKPSSVVEAVTPRAKGNVHERDRGMNKTEMAYRRHLEGEKREGRILWFDYECMKLRLADRCFYTPDFMVMDADGHIIFVDTKALWKSIGKPGIAEDALIKMKGVAEKYPMFTFKATWEQDGIWKERIF